MLTSILYKVLLVTWTVLVTSDAVRATELWSKRRHDPEEYMNVSQIITYHGYSCEEHTVLTGDGFLLGVQRIPHQRGATNITRGTVFLQHGLLSSAADWVTNLPNQSLGFVLADAGYDVWLGNSRGNTYSRRHVKYKSTDKKFWQWSWDEMSEYDLPATLSYILTHTSNRTLYYVGHSQGTTIAFAMFSNPAHQHITSKVKAFFALAPVTTVKHIISPIRYFAPFTIEIELLFAVLGVREFLPSDWLIKLLARQVCDRRAVDTLCANVMFLTSGYDRAQLNKTRLPVYYSHTPAGTSVRNIIHFAQMVRSGKFQMFDHGFIKNYEIYGQLHPPVYSVSNVTAPVAVFTGSNDWLADPADVKLLLPQITRPIGFYTIPKWDHLDFIWGLDARTLLYDKMIDIMRLL